MNSMPLPKLFVFTNQKLVIFGFLYIFNIILIPEASESVFNLRNFFFTILGAWILGGIGIQAFHEEQKLTKFSFAFSLIMAGLFVSGGIYLANHFGG